MKLPSFISDTLNFFNPPKITIEELLKEKNLELYNCSLVIYESKTKKWVLNNGYFEDHGIFPEYKVIITSPEGKETIFTSDKRLDGETYKNYELFPRGKYIFVYESSHFPDRYSFVCVKKSDNTPDPLS